MAARAPRPTAGPSSSVQNKLFEGLRYFVASSITSGDRSGLRELLNGHGATETSNVSSAELVFTETEDFEGSESMSTSAHKVLPQWAQRSIDNKTRQGPEYFSPDPRAIFSTLVICSDHLPPGDLEAVIAATRAKGGIYRDGLSRDVTHLLVLAPAGDKYHTARKYANQTNIKVVMANWFDDCLKTQHRVPERLYEQAIVQAAREHEGKPPPTDEEQKRAQQVHLTVKAKHFYNALMRAATPPLEGQSSPSKVRKSGVSPQEKQVWEGRRIMLSHTLSLSSERRQMVELEIGRAGGVIVHPFESSRDIKKEETAGEIEENVRFELDFANGGEAKQSARISDLYRTKDRYEALRVLKGEVDVLVTKYRSGLQYIAALRSNYSAKRSRTPIMVGTLAWLFYAQTTGTVSYPTEQLLHFPIRRGAVEGVRGKQITVTNYKGPTREYLKKLINAMAGPRGNGPEAFSAALSKNISLVIAGKLEGEKIRHAQDWKIPIVSHLWLEDTFRDWTWCPLSDSKYNHWTPNLAYNEVSPGCRIGDDPAQRLQNEMQVVKQEMIDIGYDADEINAAFKLEISTLEDLLELSSGAVEEVPSSAVVADGDFFNDAMEDLEEGYPGDEEEEQQEIVPNSSPTKTLGLAPGPGPRVTVRTGVGYTPGESPTKFSTKPSRMAEDAGRNSEASTSKRPSSSTVTATKGPSSSHNLGAVNSTQQYQPLLLRSPFDPSPSKRPASGVVVNDTPPARKNPEAKQRTIVGPAPAISASSKMTAGGRADVSADPSTPRRKSNMFKPKSKQPKPKPVELSSEEEEKAKGPSFSDEHENLRSENEDDGPVPVPSSRGTSPDQLVEEEDDDVGWGDDVEQADNDRMDLDEGNVLLSSSKKKGKMRVMRTQDSDEEEFQIESQKGLMARRKKVVDAGAAVPTKTKDTKPETTMKNERVRKMWRGTSEENESDDGAAYRDRKGDSKHAKEPKMAMAMRRLRDSISGKEDSSGAKVKEGVKKKPESTTSRKPVEKSRKEEKASSGGEEEEEEEEEEDSEILVARTTTAGRSVTTSTTGRGTTTSEEGRARGKRGAAAQAAQRLHSIMPDANLFEEQKKKGKIRGEWEEQDGQKRSVASSAKGKRRRGTEESDGDGQDDEDEGEKRKKRRSVGVEIKRERSGSIVDAGVRFIATKVNLTPQQLQGLRKLGIRSVDDAQSCTHLVSNSILRTEKFLCALSYGPKAVKSSWLTDCLAKQRVLDTKEYFLYDAAGERTYGVNLDHSLRRARENPGKLFEGHTFYLSPNLDPLRMTTLTNAIKAAGGSVQRIFPGVRSHYHSNSDQRLHQDLELHLDTKHFVSQEGDKDADRWSELTTRGVPVYSSDFVLSAILKQQMGDLMDRKVMLAKPST